MDQGLLYIIIAIVLIIVVFGSLTNFVAVALPSIVSLFIAIFIVLLLLKGIRYLL